MEHSTFQRPEIDWLWVRKDTSHAWTRTTCSWDICASTKRSIKSSIIRVKFTQKSAKIVRAVATRVLVYGSILAVALWWMLWTPGDGSGVPMKPLGADELALSSELRGDVHTLAAEIGERNVSAGAARLDQAAEFIVRSMTAAGYEPQSQWYPVGGVKCRNVEVEIRGTSLAAEVVIVGAHYDTVPGSPGADDNASGVAVMLALARRFAGTQPGRTLRFVAFTNEEPPYFWTTEMGSLVYARKCREQGDRVNAMLSIESVGFYSSEPRSQRYPMGLGLLYPSEGDFVAFVGNLRSRWLVHRAIGVFRNTRTLPSIGAALPNSVPGAGWSDHWSFWQQGFASIEITDTAPYRNPYYHTSGDTAERVDYDRLAPFAGAMVQVVKALTADSQ